MRSGYLQTVSTVAIGSLAFGAAVAKKAEAQDGYAFSFAGGVGEASGLNFDSGGGDFFSSDLGHYGSIMVSKQFGASEGYVGLSFYDQDSSKSLSGGPGPSGGAIFPYAREFTSWKALDIGLSQPTGSPGLSWGAGLRGLNVEHGAGIGGDIFPSGGGAVSGGGQLGFEYGPRVKFTGLGPRVSAKYATPASARQFGFSGEVGAAALYGRRTTELYGTLTYGGNSVNVASGYTDDGFIVNLDLTLQGEYHLSDSSNIFAGVHVTQFMDLAEEFDADDVRTESFFMGFKTEF